MKRISTILAACAVLVALADAGTAPGAGAGTLTIDSASTTTAVARLTLTVGPLTRQAGIFHGSFHVKVVPLFFLSESGTLSAKVSDDALHKLAAGNGIDFVGSAVSDNGKTRAITGHATPAALDHGSIVLSFPGATGKLLFSTTYHLAGG